MNGRPNDERHFVHKKLLGGISAISGLASGIIPGASLVSGISGRLAGRGSRPSPQLPSLPGSFGAFGGAFKRFSAARTAAPACPEGFELDENGRCARTGLVGRAQRFVPGGKTGFAFPSVVDEPTEFGDATLGRFGAGLQPAIRSMETRVCPRGSVLGVDGLCYNKRDLRNADRFWPQGRRPLLTGGEMRCITVAARAASKIRTKTKQLQKMEMLPKATARRAPRRIAAGHHAHVEHD